MRRNRVLWFSGLLTIFLMVGLGYYLRDLEPTLVVAQLTFSQAAFENVLSSWSPEQVQRFSRHFAADYVFVAVYGLFGWLLGHRLAASHSAPSGSSRLLPWLLPAAGIFDCAENVLHQAFLLYRTDGLFANLYFAAGLAALVKWGLALVFIALAIRAWRKNAA